MLLEEIGSTAAPARTEQQFRTDNDEGIRYKPLCKS